MIFMYLFYFLVVLGMFLALYKYVLKPIIAAEEKKEAEEKKRRDEMEAKNMARQAELIGLDISEDLEVRLIQLEELSAQMSALAQTRIIAERIAEVKEAIDRIKADIEKADKVEDLDIEDAEEDEEEASTDEGPEKA